MAQTKNMSVIALSAAAAALLTLAGCGGGGGGGGSTPSSSSSSVSSASSVSSSSSSVSSSSSSQGAVCSTFTTPATNILSGDITGCVQLTSDKNWILDGLVVVKPGATLKIDAGTTVAGKDGTGDATSYMIVDKGAKILAEGTEQAPIIFTSEKALNGEAAAVGQWGGLTIIGKAGNAQVNPYEVNSNFAADATDPADSSGILRHVKILNSGITMAQDKEINGLSMVGVGSGTVVENITVDLSDDDGIELWGGTVNLSNILITRCTDDHFDIDDGYSGTVTNLKIIQHKGYGNAAIEMSGTTAATFNGLTIVQNGSGKEGTVFFKGDGIGGHFNNAVIIDNVGDANGVIHSDKTPDATNTSFTNVTLEGVAGVSFTGANIAAVEAKFNAGTGNKKAFDTPAGNTLTGDITSSIRLTNDRTWIIDGLVAVKNGAMVSIQEGTTIAGKDGTGDATSYIVVDKGSQMFAAGTEASPIVFTSKTAVDGGAAAVGQWGGLTFIGHAANSQVNPYEVNSNFVADATNMADSSGYLKYVHVLNSGITMAQDKEINGISMVGVGSGTLVENITVNNSDDDCFELWGGTVNLTDVTLTNCTDDYFDIDDGYSGTVTNLIIVQETLGNAGMEMSGTTAATFKNLSITQNGSAKEGTVFFKGDGIGGHFDGATITDNVGGDYGAIHSDKTASAATTSFKNVTINGTATGARFTGPSAAALEAVFDAGLGNSK